MAFFFLDTDMSSIKFSWFAGKSEVFSWLFWPADSCVRKSDRPRKVVLASFEGRRYVMTSCYRWSAFTVDITYAAILPDV